MEEITGYPQLPPMTEAEIDEFLAGSHLARLSTINPDGTPHTMPIWYEWCDGEFRMSTQTVQRKVENIRRDPRVTVLVDTDHFPYRGVMAAGEAVLDTEDAVHRRIPIFQRYVDNVDDATRMARRLAEKWDPVMIHLRPTTMTSFDYSKGSLQPLQEDR